MIIGYNLKFYHFLAETNKSFTERTAFAAMSLYKKEITDDFKIFNGKFFKFSGLQFFAVSPSW